MFRPTRKPKLNVKKSVLRPSQGTTGAQKRESKKASQESSAIFKLPSSQSDFAAKQFLSKGSERLRTMVAEDSHSSTVNQFHSNSALLGPKSSQSGIDVIIKSQPSDTGDMRSLPASSQESIPQRSYHANNFARFGRERNAAPEPTRAPPPLPVDNRRRINNTKAVVPVRLLRLRANGAGSLRSFDVYAEKDVYAAGSKGSMRLIEEKVIETAQDDDVVTDDDLLQHGV